MNTQEAREILGIEDESSNLEALKKKYRDLAKIYHPDRVSGDARRFLHINAAYELLKGLYLHGNQASYNEENEDDLKDRVEAVNSAFSDMSHKLQEKYNDNMQYASQQIVEKLSSYYSSSQLHENLECDFEAIVNDSVLDLTQWFNNNLASIAIDYDNWINSFLQDTYSELRERELRNWYRSVFFGKNLLPAVLTGCLSFLTLGIWGYWTAGGLSLVCSLIIAYFFYKLTVKSRLEVSQRVFKLDIDSTQLSSERFQLNLQRKFAKDDSRAAALITGATLGGANAGIGGAIVGGIFGSLLGGLFGEPLHELKKRTLDALNTRFENICQEIADSLNKKTPEIQRQLIKAIHDNYERNRQRTIKLIMASPGNKSKKFWYTNTSKENPLSNANVVGITICSILICSLIFLFALFHL